MQLKTPDGRVVFEYLTKKPANIGLTSPKYSAFSPSVQEVFHGCPILEDGYIWPSTKPGWGIEARSLRAPAWRTKSLGVN